MGPFDYIIIGAGSAGCVLANRLSANPQRKVLLLEAGPEDKEKNIQIPAAFSKLFKSEVDWDYVTLPQNRMANRCMYQPRGKVLGGCSSINAMIYIRGHRKDYDNWSELGNKGWSYEEVLPFFKKSENQAAILNEFHGQGGELSVDNLRTINLLSDAFLKASEEAGYPLNPEFNGIRQEGFGLYQLTQSNGERCSAAMAFLHPVRSRPNLTILTNAHVHRITIENGTATGISYESGGEVMHVRAHSEVLLCAGAFNSPQLLMLSGIGEEEELRKHNIEIRHLLPGVGKNLQDHLICGLIYNCNQNITLDRIEDFPAVVKNLFNYFIFKKGPFTSNVAEAGGFVRTRKDVPAPDLQFHFGPAYFIEHGFRNPGKGNGYSLGATLIQPHSKGEIRLASGDPGATVLIDPNYFSDNRDLDTMITGLEICQKILDQKAFDPFRLSPHLPERPFQSKEECIRFIQDNSETLYHPVGTCKMGKDPMAVVDHELRVHGVRKLRVIDASIMPVIPRGNTNAPVIMIAEKAAEMILKAEKSKTAMAAGT